jgi:hypothetical protein
MLQRLLIITLTLCSLTASAQWQQTGSKVRYVNGLGIPTKDTAAGVAADSSQILIRPADSSLYIKYKRTWVKVGAGGGGTIGGSGTINRVPKFTASTTLGNSSIVDSASAVAMTITPSGNVGIGTTSAGVKLDINSTTTTFIRGVASGGQGLNLAAGSLSAAIVQTGTGYLAFHTNSDGNLTLPSNERMRVTSGGNVGIGSYTSPAAKLVVDGTTLINTNTDNGVDKLQVSGSIIASTLKVNTSGQTLNISTFYNSGAGNNLWINNTAPSTVSGNDNIGIGQNSMTNTTSGYYNVAIGNLAMKSVTTAFRNTAIGHASLEFLTSGTDNVALGINALNLVASGTDNFGLGAFTLANCTASKNVGIGSTSLNPLTSGSSNIAIGFNSGRYISGGTNNTTSSQSLYLGEDTRASANGNSNEIVIGHTNIGQGSNTATLGNSSITKTFLRGNTMVNTTTDNGVDELQVQGSISGIGFKQAYVTKTGAYTATNDDYVIDCTSGTFTVTLPASSGRTGRILIIKNSGAGTITVDGNGAETIDGAATYSLAVQYATVQIMSDGTNWKIIAKF